MNLEKYLPFYKQLSQDTKRYLEKHIYFKHYKKDDIISSGHECLGLLLVKEGSIRVYMISEEGKEISLYHLYNNDLCIFTGSCMFKGISFQLHIETTQDSLVYIIPSHIYQELMESNPSVGLYTNQIMSSRFSEVMWLLDQVLNKQLDSRISAYLYQKYEEKEEILLYLTHEDIACELGTAREVVSRILKYLQDENIVQLSRGMISLINLVQLKKLGYPSLRK